MKYQEVLAKLKENLGYVAYRPSTPGIIKNNPEMFYEGNELLLFMDYFGTLYYAKDYLNTEDLNAEDWQIAAEVD